MFDNFRFLVLFAGLVCVCISSPLNGDEVILDENNYDDTFLGDFSFSPGQIQSKLTFQINPGARGVNAGELWTYFNSQGISTLDHLTICMDVDPQNDQADIGVQQVELTIEDPFDRAALLSYSLDRDGDNSLIVPGYEASSYRTEATMKIDLGFDFMERFSESSTQKIFFNVEMDHKANSSPNFYIASNDNNYFAFPGFLTLALFAAFWITVFAILFLITNPASRRKTKQAIST